MKRALLPLLLLSLSACGIGDKPCQPGAAPADCGGIEIQVQTVMDAKCASCHGEMPIAGAPGGFRLDIFEGTDGTDSRAARVIARSLDGTMPPGGGLTTEETATISKWDSCRCMIEE